MDILADGMEESSSFELNDLVETQPTTTNVPVSSVRNRAASSAILSGDPTQMVDKYRLLMQEGMEGRQVTHNQLVAALEQQERTKSMKHVINILGDKTIPLEQKQRLMDVVQKQGFKAEPAVVLQTRALEEASPGEDLRGEAARISLADTMSVIHKEAQERQRMMNGLMATLPSASASTVGEIAEAEVMPFGRNVIAARVAAKMNELDGKPTSLGDWVKNFLLPGSTKADLQEKLLRIPPDKRGEYTQQLLNAIKDSATVFQSENYYAQFQTATRLLDEPMHSNAQIWTENMMTVLDSLWVGQEIKSLGKAGKASRSSTSSKHPSDDFIHKADWELVQEPHNPFAPKGQQPTRIEYKRADSSKRLELNSVVRRENPVAPYNIVEQANPASARAMHEAMVDGGDELAEVLTGVNREQALANNIMPQVATESGAVLNKVNQELKDVVTNTGSLRYTANEFESAFNLIKHDFRTANGLEINDAMTTFHVDGDHIIVDAHYATSGGSFTSAQAAKDQAKLALRNYGIRDDEIIVMKREGMDYVPVADTMEGVGDYQIKVRSRLPIDDSEVASWSDLDVKKNWTDRISQLGTEDKGSVAAWMFDPASMLHPTITNSASVATDQAVTIENYLLKPIKDFRNVVYSFPAERRMMLNDYIMEANTKGLQFDKFNLAARGFNQSEINALEKWKQIWDNHYYLENNDLVRTLNSQGYMVLDAGGTKLFGKPVLQKNQNISNVLDPSTNTVRSLTKAEMDDLYDKGGHYAALRRPISLNGVEVEHFIVRNTPTEYLRKLRDTDSVLNYRHGYYTMSYKKGSKFVDEITVDASGKEVRKTVAVAGNTRDAEIFAQSSQQSTGNRHVVREDSRGFAKDGDGYWDVNSASGRIAQRIRGKALVEVTGVNQIGAGVHIENPMESATRAARSIAGRTIMRPVIETAKKRFVEQYGDLIQADKMGRKTFPNHRTEIVDHKSHVSKRAADARTTYQYIRYLENGYINSMDQVFKGGMQAMADMFGKYGLSKAENVAQAVGEKSVSQLGKGTVFYAYIVTSNPIRQWIVQSHQATRTAAYNPMGMVSGNIPKLISGYIGNKGGFPGVGSADFVKFVDDSGMVAGVDRNSLVRGLKLDMADRSSPAWRAAGTVASMPQTVGFDIGEKMNQLGHLAAVYDKYLRDGKNLASKTIRDEALAEARALSYDLNRAGEFAYTQSSPAIILQFLQMPHKALVQLSNRKLDPVVRLRMAAWDLVMFGAPTGLIGAMVTAGGGDGGDILPDDPETRDKFVYGMEAFYLNKLFTILDDSGEKSRIDFSSLNPYGFDGWAKMYNALMEDGLLAAYAASPTAQLMAINGVNDQKRNGRIPQAVITMGRFFNVFEELDPENPTEFSAVLNDAAKISSGWTTWSNAKLMYETRLKMDSAGGTVDEKVTIPEVWATALGFGTLGTKELYALSKSRSDSKKAHEEDVMKRYRDIVQYVTTALQTDNNDLAHTQKVMSMLMRTFDNPDDLKMVVTQWKKDMTGRDLGLLKQMIEASGIPNAEKFKDDVKMWNTDEQTKKLILERQAEVNKFSNKDK